MRPAVCVTTPPRLSCWRKRERKCWLQGMMSVVEKDPGALKLSVLLLMLHHPEGFKFGDFSGAFQQLHGYHPQLSLHGYHSLKDLLAEMKDVVVLEGDSQNPVIKVASDLDLDQWLEENRWDDGEEEIQSSLDDDDAGAEGEAEEATGKFITGAEEATGVLDLLRSLLSTYEHGLRIERIQEYLLARDIVDLAKLSISQGYKDTLEFLEQRMPELTIKYQKKRLKCVVRLTAGTAKKLLPPVSSSSCKEVLNTGFHSTLNCPPPSQDLSPALSQTAQNPEPRTEKNKEQNRMDPFLSTNEVIPQIKELQLQELTATEEGDPAALKRNVLHLVLQHPEGVKFGDFSGAFQQLHGYAPKLALHGYHSLRNLVADMKNVVVLEGNSQNPFIKAARPSHLYRWMEGGDKNRWGDSEGEAQNLTCEAAAGADAARVLELLTSLLSPYMSGLRIEKVQEFLLAQNGVDLETFSISQGYKDTLEFLEHQMPGLTIQYREDRLKCVVQLTAGTAEKKPPVSNSSSKEFQTNQPCTTLDSQNESQQRRSAGALELLTSLLSTYKSGLRIEKVQEFLLAQNRVDLETFSIAQGYKDTLEFLERRMPGLTIQYRENRVKCVIRLTAGSAEKKQPPVSRPSCKKVLHTGVTLPSSGASAHQGLPLNLPKTAQHPEPRTEKNKIQNGSKPPPSTNHAIMQGLTEEGDHAALKRNVLHLVLLHPEGISFAEFSGAFQQLHGFPPKLALHGYPSLRLLVADMKDVVVLEGDSKNPVIKVACESHLYQCLEEGEENRLDDSEGKSQSLSYEAAAAAGEDADISSLFPSAIGHNIVEESANQAPEFSIAFVAIRNVLECQPKGLKVKKLKEALREKYNLDLERLRSGLGYTDIVSLLQDMPGLLLRNSNAVRNCVVQLQSGPSSPVPSLDTDFSACNSNGTFEEPMRKESDPCVSTSAKVSAPLSFDSEESSIRSKTSSQRKVEKKPTLAEIVALISRLLSSKGYEKGLRVKKVQELLLSKEEVDLEKFSIAQGYKDSLAFLECHMPELKIKYEENQLSCVLHLGSDSCISASTQVSVPLAFDSEESSIKSELSTQKNVENKPALEEVLVALSSLLSTKGYVLGLRLKKVQELLLTKEGINLEKFSIAQGYKDSLAFLECHMPELKISYQENQLNCLIQLGPGLPGSCFSTSSQANTPPSFDSKQSSIKSESLNQRKMGKNPALEEVLALLSSLLRSKPYQSGLKLKKVQELLLTKEGLDLEKFSIAQGHKDSLAFVECHMPEHCLIKYQEDRLSCVLQLGSDCGANSVPPLRDAPVPLMKTVRTARPENPPSGFGSISKQVPTPHDSSANRPWIQSLSAPSTIITPVSQEPHGAILGRDESPSQPQSGISAQPSSECQLRRTPPTEELPSLPDPQQLRRSNLTGPHHSKDLDELKQEVAHVLARHPEGVSLFQFRTEYSAAFQKHLPLGNAASAKQCLLQMPDVVCLKGYGVQTLLFPVSSKESSLKTGQQILSRVENAVVVPGHSVSKAVPVADPVLVFQPSLPTASVRSQPHTIDSLTSGHLGEPGKAEISVLHQSDVLEAPTPRTLLQERKMARAKLGDRPGPSCLTNTAEAATDCGNPLSEIYPVLVPKSSAPKITVAPVAFPHLYSECFKPLSDKETCPDPETSPQRPPKMASPMEEQVQTSTRPRGTHLLPPSPVVPPSDCGEVSSGFPSKPTHPAKPWTSDASTPAPSPSQRLPASFMTWAQPLVFPPVMFLTPLPPSSASVQNTSRIQPQNVAYQSSAPQALPQMRPVQPASPVRSAEQRNYVHVAQGPGAFSQSRLSARTVMHAQSQAPVFAVDGLPVSLPPQNPFSSYAFRSQTVYQSECYHHPWLDYPQCRSMTSAVHNSIMTTPSARAPSQHAAYWNQSAGGNPFVTSPSAPASFPPAPTHMPQQPSYASSRIVTHSDALASSDLCASPHPLEPRTLSINNRDPQALYTDVQSTISPITTLPASSPTSVYLPTQTSGQPSYTSYNSTTDYGAPDHTRSLMATSKETEKQDNCNVAWVDKQKPRLTQRPTGSYSSALQNSPPPKSPGKCIIL